MKIQQGHSRIVAEIRTTEGLKAKVGIAVVKIAFVLVGISSISRAQIVSFQLPIPEIQTLRSAEFWGTTYHVYSANPSPSDGVALLDRDGRQLGTPISRKDWCLAALEGTVRVAGHTYNFSQNAQSRQVDCHDFFSPEVGFSRFADARGPFGDGINGFQLVPFRTIATDPKFLAPGTVIYIPAARGYRMPDGTMHDGYFFAGDAGGAIKGNHVDFFCGDQEIVLPFASSNSQQTFKAYIVEDPNVLTILQEEHKGNMALNNPFHLQTIFVIVFENQNWSGIRNNKEAPYINKTILPTAAYSEHYFTPPKNHPSLPNYLWIESGSNWGIREDITVKKGHQSTPQHLVSLLAKQNIAWKAYEEDIDGVTCPLTDDGQYRTKHNPFVYFDDVTDGQRSDSKTCIEHVRPFAEMKKDLGTALPSSVAPYNFITPNICHDMHAPCGVADGDSWLATNLPVILNSSAYKTGGAVFIVWDEGTNDSDGPLGLMVLSPNAKVGPGDSTLYTHSSLLKTLEEIFAVKPLLGDAARADVNDLRKLFVSFP